MWVRIAAAQRPEPKPGRAQQNPPASLLAAVRPALPTAGKTGSAQTFVRESVHQTPAVSSMTSRTTHRCPVPVAVPSSAARRWCTPQSVDQSRHASSSARGTPWVPAPKNWPTAMPATALWGAVFWQLHAWAGDCTWAPGLQVHKLSGWLRAWRRASNGPWQRVCPCHLGLSWPRAFSARPCSQPLWRP